MVESNIQNILLPVHRRKSNEKSIEKLAREIFPGKLFYGKLSGVAKVGQPAISRLTIWIIEKIIEYSLPVGRQAKPPPAAYGVCHGFCIFASEWKLDARAKAAPPQTVSRPLQNRAAKTAPSRALKLSARSVTLFAFCGQLKFSPSTSSWQALDWHSFNWTHLLASATLAPDSIPPRPNEGKISIVTLYSRKFMGSFFWQLFAISADNIYIWGRQKVS